MCHQILDQQRFNEDPRLAQLAARDDASTGTGHQGLRVDVKQPGRLTGIERVGGHVAPATLATSLSEE